MFSFNETCIAHLLLKWFSKLTKNICIVIFLYDIRFDINDATRMLFVICLAKSVKSLMKMIMFPTFRKLRLESTFLKIYKEYFFNCVFFKKINLCIWYRSYYIYRKFLILTLFLLDSYQNCPSSQHYCRYLNNLQCYHRDLKFLNSQIYLSIRESFSVRVICTICFIYNINLSSVFFHI